MPFNPQRGSFYRMPVFFGPTPGPRQWPEGRRFDFTKRPKRRVVGARFLSDAAQLTALLPDRFEVWGEPVVTVEVTYMTGIGWLAGRGYNLELEVANLSDAVQPVPSDPPNQGMLSYDYIPATGDWGVADVEYATLSPPRRTSGPPCARPARERSASSRVRGSSCRPPNHLVDAFAALGVREACGGYLLEQQGGSSVAETVRLE